MTTNETSKQTFEGFPAFNGDLFDPDVLADSYPVFREIRALGDVVWAPKLNMFLVGRFRDVQLGLRSSEALVSGRGVTANSLQHGDGIRRGPTGVLTMDGEEHERSKRLLMRPLMPRALEELKDRIYREAETVVSRLANGEEFEAMSGLASHLPVSVVANLVGLNDAGQERLLRWSLAAFDAFGPADNPRTVAALPILGEFLQYGGNVSRDVVLPGSWAAGLFDALDRGEISLDTARLMIFDYATPSLDTTIVATGEMLWRLATVDGAFEAVRADPRLIPSAVYESVRMASPIRGFTRYVERDFALSESILPQGARVFLLNASANRDERHYPEPDRFEVTRNPRDNLAWGYGKHLCVGMHLARLEMEALVGALVRSVRSIEAGDPIRLINNGLQGFRRLPLILHPK
jgi:cytochrome P450